MIINDLPNKNVNLLFKKIVPYWINSHILENGGKLPNRKDIYSKFFKFEKNYPEKFLTNQKGSAYGTLRASLSPSKKEDFTKFPGVYFITIENETYFYTHKIQVTNLLTKSMEVEKVELEARIHINTQYQLCGIFTKLGYSVRVPKNDLSGLKNKTSYNNETIKETFKETLVDFQIGDPTNNIDFLVFNQNNIPIVQIEVEETTGVLSGLQRMDKVKESNPNISSFISSSKRNYRKKFDEYSKNYKNLSAKFITAKKIESLYNKSLKVCQNDENFKNLVNKEFCLSL